MRIRVLGSSAGGGCPQWNCNCVNCHGYRQGTIKIQRRTQSSIVVSSDSQNWVLINASPDIHQQLLQFPDIQPARAVRDTGIAAIILVDSQIDHTTGLLMLRESKELPLYCTANVYHDLTHEFPILTVLNHYCSVQYHPLDLNGSYTIPKINHLRFIVVPLDSKAPPYSPHRVNPAAGDNIGLFIEDTSTKNSLFYAPGLAAITPAVIEWMKKADILLVDGTFWDEEEMINCGVSTKTASDLGHIPQSGKNGMLNLLKQLPNKRKILIHINNTNPILNEDSPERRNLSAANIEVAFDGMEL